MNELINTMNQDTPRLVVEFTRPAPDQEQFKWGIVGKLPALTLVGFIVRVQAELAFRKPEECDKMALVVAWDAEENRFEYVVDPRIPIDSLVGMLETIKLSLIGIAQVKDDKIGMFGADGRPLNYRR